MLKINDLVHWTSSSSGSTTTKRGVVEAIIKAGKRPTEAQRKEADAYGAARNHESYLIRVAGKGAKGKLYWPRASLLKIASKDATFRNLRPKGREVAELKEAIPITLTTKCPAKWAMVDMETGQIWGHDGSGFRPIQGKDAAEVAEVAGKTAKQR